MTGDDWIADEARGRNVVATRAVSIAAPPETVWPWLAQLGRGAGFYSYDAIDNGGKGSAEHIVTWIPQPQVGDASAIGYLRSMQQGRELAWWVPTTAWLGSRGCMSAVYRVSADASGDCARLVARYRGRLSGWSSSFVVPLFIVVDTLMGRRQLLGIKQRAERFGVRREDPQNHETGERDQFQLYEAIYADGERCGISGQEDAADYWASPEAAALRQAASETTA